jgi:hypothetical protein
MRSQKKNPLLQKKKQPKPQRQKGLTVKKQKPYKVDESNRKDFLLRQEDLTAVVLSDLAKEQPPQKGKPLKVNKRLLNALMNL